MSMPKITLRKVTDPNAEAGRHYETPDGRFQVHAQYDEDYVDGKDGTVWDTYDGEELVGTDERLTDARTTIANILLKESQS